MLLSLSDTLMLHKQKSQNDSWFSLRALSFVVSSWGPQSTCSWKQMNWGTCLGYNMLCLLMVGLLGCRQCLKIPIALFVLAGYRRLSPALSLWDLPCRPFQNCPPKFWPKGKIFSLNFPVFTPLENRRFCLLITTNIVAGHIMMVVHRFSEQSKMVWSPAPCLI